MNPGDAQKKKPAQPFINGGITLLLAVILVLVLVVLALLTLSAAKSDWEFSSRMAEKTTAYYAACNQAEEILAQVQSALAEAGGVQPDWAALEVEESQDALAWQVPVSENQVLQVEFSQKSEQITKWQVVSVTPWEGDDSVQILQPQERP